MKKLSIFFILFNTLVFSQTKNYIDQPYYQALASADTLVTPDQIFVQINISESDTKGKISIEQLERKMYNTLKSIGIDTDTFLTVNDMSSNYKKYLLKKKDILKNKSFDLEINNAKTLAKVFVHLEKIGISNTNIQNVKYSKHDEIQFLMKINALKKAKNEAEELTQSIGQKIGKAIFISSENYVRNYTPANHSIRMKTYADANTAPLDIEFKKIEIKSSVNVIFKLE